MNPGDWFEVAALLREFAAIIGAESADGLDGIHKIVLGSSRTYGQMTLHRRRKMSGLSLRIIQINDQQTIRITLTTETD